MKRRGGEGYITQKTAMVFTVSPIPRFIVRSGSPTPRFPVSSSPRFSGSPLHRFAFMSVEQILDGRRLEDIPERARLYL